MDFRMKEVIVSDDQQKPADVDEDAEVGKDDGEKAERIAGRRNHHQSLSTANPDHNIIYQWGCWALQNYYLAMIGPAKRQPKKQPMERREASHEASCGFT